LAGRLHRSLAIFSVTTFLLAIFHGLVCLEAVDDGFVESGRVYSGNLPPERSASYRVRLPEAGSLLVVCIDALGASFKLNVSGPISEASTNIVYYRAPYLYYVLDEGVGIIEVRNLSLNSTLTYKFYVDVTTPLLDGLRSFKSIPLESGVVSFSLNLRKGDRVEVYASLKGISNVSLEVYTLYYELAKGSLSYMLVLYKSSKEALSFEADLEGRYYLLVRSEEGEGIVSVTCSVKGSILGQSWFWIIPLLLSIPITLAFASMVDLKRMGGLPAHKRYILMSIYVSIPTIASLTATVGAYTYKASIYIPLLQLSTILYGLTGTIRLYGAILDRMEGTAVCQYCGTVVDIRVNLCCGVRVKPITLSWYLTAPSTALLLLLVGLSLKVSGLESDLLLLTAAGGAAGSLLSWYLNRKLDKWGALKHLGIGLTFSALSPIIVLTLIGILGPVLRPVELWRGVSYARIRIAPPVLPITFYIFFGLLVTIAMIYFVIEARVIARSRLNRSSNT